MNNDMASVLREKMLSLLKKGKEALLEKNKYADLRHLLIKEKKDKPNEKPNI